MFKWFFCVQLIPRFISSLWCIFVKLLLWRKIKQVLIMRTHIFSFSWLCFKIEEIKCIRIPLVSQNNNKKSLWSRHCHFHLNADTDVGTGRHSSSLRRNVRRGMFRDTSLIFSPLAPAAMVAISGYYVLLLRSWRGNADGIWNDVEKPSWRLKWWVHTRMGTTQPILPYFMKMQCVGSLQNAIWLIYSPTLSI